MDRKIIAHGIDISAHQGRVDWNKLAEWKGVHGEKVDFALLRAGYGRGNYGKAEPYIHQHIDEAAAEGIDIGLYWFCYAQTVEEAREEAQELVAIANQHKGKITYPLIFDLEYDTDDYAVRVGKPLNKKIRTNMTIAFCSECEKAGYYSMFYTNEDYLQNKLNAPQLLARFDLWQAAPYNHGTLHQLHIPDNKIINPPIRDVANIWQYYWWGEIPGINGVADLNMSFRDYPRVIREVGLNHLSPTQYEIVLTVKDKPEAERIREILKGADIRQLD